MVEQNEWYNATLGNVIKTTRLGGNYKNSEMVSLYPLIKMGNISRGYINIDKIEYIQNIKPDDLDELCYGDILFNTRNTPELVGKVAIWRGELPRAYFNSNIMRIEFIDCDHFFMNYLFNTKEMIKKMQEIAIGTTSVAAIYTRDLYFVNLIIPLLPEQRRIAAVLSDTDALIAALEKLIVKKHNIKQSAMHELLTSKRRLSGFSGEWVEKQIGDIGYTYSGLSGKRKEHFGKGNARYITFLNVLMNTIIDVDILENVDVNELENQNAVHCGDLFFNTSSETPEEVGMCAVLTKELANTYLNSFCFGFRLTDSEINGLFLSYYFNSNEGRMIMTLLAQGATRYNLSKAYFNDTILLLPSYTEQTAIAAILSDMDAEINALTTKLAKLKHIKQGMMSELLTGRIRLPEQEAEAAPAAKTVELPKRKPRPDSAQTGGHSQQFDDAVMIAGIVNVLYSDRFPLGRKKVQKCLYLLRRHQDESTAAFKKKAAGPYADEIRYKGGEPIAKKAHYIKTTTVMGKGTTFACDSDIGKALGYIQSWGKQDDIKWVDDKLKFKKVDELELLATVDMAICDLEEAGITVSVNSIKNLIATNREWKAKLKKQTFSDANIAYAIQELQVLL